MLTNKQLVEFVKRKLGVKSAYMWGEFGRVITNSTIAQKASQYPGYYSKARQNYLKTLVGKNYYGCDCVGLYKWFLWTDNDAHAIRYNSATDRGTLGMFNAATERGDINNMPEIPGLITYMKGHVGVYIGNGEVVECTLGKYGDGIVKTKLKGRGWTRWLKMPEITYVTEPEPTPKPVDYIMTVNVASLALHNNNKRWIGKGKNSTVIAWMSKGETVTYFPGTETKLGQYTSVKVKYKNLIGYCAKNYLK